MKQRAIRQHVVETPAPIVAEVLGYRHVTTAKLAAQTGATWSRYASGDRSLLDEHATVSNDLASANNWQQSTVSRLPNGRQIHGSDPHKPHTRQ